MKRLLILSILAVAACGRSPRPGEPVTFSPKDGSFTAALPAGWRVDDAATGARLAAFYGPLTGPAPFSQSLAVSFYAKGGRWKTARTFLESESAIPGAPPRPPLDAAAREVVFVRRSLSTHGGPAEETVRLATVPGRDGFFAVESVRPSGTPASPDVDAFLASFKPAR